MPSLDGQSKKPDSRYVPEAGRGIRHEGLVYLVLALIALFPFWQIQDHQFVNFDDQAYVTENRIVKSGITAEGMVWAFTSRHEANWHPLTWLSHMLDVELYGLNPRGHHLTSLLLHLANTLLLFGVLKRMTGAIWSCAFVAILFAIHPLHVESVAWVAERKDVLSTLFWMLTMGAYLYYIRRPGMGRYLWVLLFFIFGLMSKPMIVTLPFVLLLLDVWPLKRLRWATETGNQRAVARKSKEQGPYYLTLASYSPWELIREKIPLIGLTVISSVITYIVQQTGGAVSPLKIVPIELRIANALVSYVLYIWKMLWPQKLAVFYPHPLDTLAGWQIGGAFLFLILMTYVVLKRIRQQPYLAVGWFWYLGTLVPVIGIVQVGAQAMADRYTYVPLIGLFIMIAWGVSDLLPKSIGKSLLRLSAGALLSLLMVFTMAQVGYWKDSVTLFKHAIRVTSQNSIALTNLGSALVNQGRYEEGMGNLSRALQLDPRNPVTHFTVGFALAEQDKLEEAINHYSESLRINPEYERAHNNYGTALARLGRLDEAKTHFMEVLRINPSHEQVHLNLGNVLLEQGAPEEAITHYFQFFHLNPNRTLEHADAYNSLGLAYFKLGRLDQAIQEFKTALQINPQHSAARNNLEIVTRSRETSAAP